MSKVVEVLEHSVNVVDASGKLYNIPGLYRIGNEFALFDELIEAGYLGTIPISKVVVGDQVYLAEALPVGREDPLSSEWHSFRLFEKSKSELMKTMALKKECLLQNDVVTGFKVSEK